MADTEYGQLSKMTDRNPVQETRYQQLKSQGAPLYTSDGGGGYADIAQQQMELAKQANAPIVSSLQSSIPEVQQKYAAESGRLQAQQAPLEKRYQNLLDEVTRQGQVATTAEQTATTREFGRRGISTQSGIFDQTLNERLLPITQATQGQTAQIGQSREDALMQLQNLINQTGESGVSAVRDIQNAIAQLQAGGNNTAIQSALSMYQNNQQSELAKQQLAMQQAQAAQEAAYASQANPLQLALLQAQVNKANQDTSGGGGATMADLFRQFQAEQQANYTNSYVSQNGMDAAIKAGLVGPAVYK